MMANRLHESTSPYLLQHADNPVDWFEWGNEAFSEAIRRDVPVLLSVGYSACHWCHVMAHESFEDGPTAAEMNRLFVNVKVDREERPDVDAIYMEAVQSMTGHGGWPMTVWLTPEGHPFFAGTYFPSRDRGGLPSFRRVLAGVSQAWQERRGDVAAQAGRISETLAAELPMGDSLPSADSIEAAYRALASAYDPTFGGFGSAPKFPQQPVLEFLLRLTSHTRNTGAASMLGQTLEYMAAGGIHDQLGGGFARYAVDQGWQIPHFEKMLYDNAQLARLFLWAGLELDRPDLVDVARTTLDYLLADLRHPDGGFFSAEDADSEGVEGKFYTWTHVEFNEVAGADAAVARAAWGVTPAGNFDGANVLHRALRPTEVATLLQSSPDVVSAGLDRARRRLLQRRNTRVRPGLDYKVVAGWNGLAIRALAEAGAALDEPRYLEAAGKAAHFVLNRMSTAGGGLARTWAKGRAGRVSAFLEDYAAIGIGLLSLFAATGEVSWFQHAEGIVRQLPDRFGSDGGGMYSSENSDLIKRPKDLFDNPAPSGNSLAAEAMLLLSLYTGDLDLRAVAEANLMAVAPLIDRYPTAAGHALAVIVSLHRGTKELAVVGPEATALSRVYWRRYRPNVVLAMAAADTPQVPLLTDRARPGQTLAYVCAGLFCLAPTDSAATLVASLDNS